MCPNASKKDMLETISISFALKSGLPCKTYIKQAKDLDRNHHRSTLRGKIMISFPTIGIQKPPNMFQRDLKATIDFFS